MKILILTLMVFLPSLTFASLNLDSCKTNIEELLNVRLAKNKKINLDVNDVLFQGHLLSYTETGMEGRIGWSVYEKELEHAYRSQMFATHHMEDGDRVFINDENGNLIVEGYYKEKIMEQVLLVHGKKVKFLRNYPELYKDKNFTELVLNIKGFIRLFNQRNSASLIKKRDNIPEFILDELLLGQLIYERHLQNPDRFVQIGKGQIVELKPNHELIRIKIDRDIDKKYALDKFFFRNLEGIKVFPYGRIFVVHNNGTVTLYENAFQSEGQKATQIAKMRPEQIWLEKRMYSY